MEIQSFKPECLLSNFIKYYWTISGNCQVKDSKKTILPYSESCLIFLVSQSNCSKGIYLCPPNIKAHDWYFINSLNTDNSSDFFYVDVSFYPGVLYELFKIPFEKLENRAYPIEELSIDLDKSILDKLYENKNDKKEIFNILNNYFYKLFYNFYESEFLFNIRNLHFNCQLDEFYDNLNLSMRQIQRDMNKFTGLNARTIQRISRFYKALNRIKIKDYKSLSTVSQDLKFYDQSHLLKELKFFTGKSFKEFSKNTSKYIQLEIKHLI